MARRSPTVRATLYGLNLLVILFLIAPLIAVVFGSVQTERALLTDVLNPLPKQWTLANFRLIFSGGKETGTIFSQANYVPASLKFFPQALRNSVIVAMSVTFLTLTLGAFAAYAIARLRFRWTRALLYSALASRLVPLIVLIVPLYVTLRNLQLLNSLPGTILTEVGFLLPYSIWILTPYFASLPGDLEDAARIDGCSRFGTFLRIVLPLSAPGLAANGVIMFILSWNELLIPLIVSAKPTVMTVPVLLAGLVSDYYVFYTLMMAISLIGLLPTVILAMVLQRYVVRGLTSGALKG